jgi:4-O-beta-D-mannosyl-D-glucose phosphorylase
VATSTIEKLLDYVINTPADGFSSAETVKTLVGLIEKNQSDVLAGTSVSSQGNKHNK